MFLFKPREDVVFAAINKSQCIRLFEKGKDFQLRTDESVIYTGTYAISNDTVFLFYQDEIDLSFNPKDTDEEKTNEILPLKLLISENASLITAAQENLFSAQVYVDMRNKTPHKTPDKLHLFQNQQPIITAIKTTR